VYLRRICYSSGSKFSYSDFVPLPRVGDLSLSESTDPSVKHVGSVQLSRVNFEERKLPKRFYHSTRTIGQKVETLDPGLRHLFAGQCRLLSTTRSYMEWRPLSTLQLQPQDLTTKEASQALHADIR
jgi:hypothetical protein